MAVPDGAEAEARAIVHTRLRESHRKESLKGKIVSEKQGATVKITHKKLGQFLESLKGELPSLLTAERTAGAGSFL